MTTREARGVVPVETEEETIAAYLQHNPDFFERHHAVLARMRLPHARSGATISLVERQIEVLRDKHAAVEAKLAEFVRVARANDALADKLHGFTRRLLRAGSRDAAIETMESSLRVDFDAFHSVLVLIGPHPDVAAQRFVRVVRAEDPNLKSFETLFANGKPRCGQARDSQREFLFGADASDIGSVALVPLGEKGSVGLLALGSTDRDRFHPGMSTEFLARMADLITDALAPAAMLANLPAANLAMSPAASLPTTPAASLPTTPAASLPTTPAASLPTTPAASLPTTPAASLATTATASVPSTPAAAGPTPGPEPRK